jgi:hypothetical protein
LIDENGIFCVVSFCVLHLFLKFLCSLCVCLKFLCSPFVFERAVQSV